MTAPAHVVRLGAPAVKLHAWLCRHDDGEVSWTYTAARAAVFVSAAAARRFAAARLGGDWHVESRAADLSRRALITLDEVDPYPFEDGADRESAGSCSAPAATILTREQGLALADHRQAVRRAALLQAWRL